jgi:hypothetical protein
MLKNLKVRAVALATFALFSASVAVAAGFPIRFSLANGAASPVAISTNPVQFGWADRILFDTASGTSATVQVIIYDAATTAQCTAANIVGTFTLSTNTAGAVQGVVNNIAQGNQKLDFWFNRGCYVGVSNTTADAVTGTIVIGHISDSRITQTK